AARLRAWPIRATKSYASAPQVGRARWVLLEGTGWRGTNLYLSREQLYSAEFNVTDGCHGVRIRRRREIERVHTWRRHIGREDRHRKKAKRIFTVRGRPHCPNDLSVGRIVQTHSERDVVERVRRIERLAITIDENREAAPGPCDRGELYFGICYSGNVR